MLAGDKDVSAGVLFQQPHAITLKSPATGSMSEIAILRQLSKPAVAKRKEI